MAVRSIDCGSDEHAQSIARESIGLFAAVEVWAAGRCVARVTAANETRRLARNEEPRLIRSFSPYQKPN